MNNVKYYNDSLAYDFEMFAPKTAETPKTRDNIVVMPKIAEKTRKRRRAAARRLVSPMGLVMTAVFVLAGLCGNIALRLQINELKKQVLKWKCKRKFLMRILSLRRHSSV